MDGHKHLKEIELLARNSVADFVMRLPWESSGKKVLAKNVCF